MTAASPTIITAPERGDVTHVPLAAYGTQPALEHVLDRASALAINAAIVTERPLLLRGEPGTGKSQLARAAAALLGRRLLVHAVDARTETRDLLYTVDAVARLAYAQLAGAIGTVRSEAVRDIDVMKFVHPGPLWWAFNAADARKQCIHAGVAPPFEGAAASGVVLLIDEIDKADPSVPNGLLDAFGSGTFSVEARRSVEATTRPLVVLTTNEERALPDAFVRRCLVHHIELPTDKDAFIAALRVRGSANVKDCDAKVLTEVASLIFESRAELKKQGTCLPGVAEYIDLLRAVTSLAAGADAQIALLAEIKELATRKHPADGAV